MSKKTTSGKLIRYVVVASLASFVIIFLIMMFTQDFDLGETVKVLKSTKWWWILVAALTNLGTFFLESFQLWFLSKAMQKKTSFWRMLQIYFVGLFFANASPSTSGGEPMQIWFLLDDGYSIAEGSVLVFVKGIISIVVRMVFVLIILALIPLGFNLNLATAQYVTFIVTTVGFLLLAGVGIILISKPHWFTFVFRFLARFKLMQKWMGVTTPSGFYKKSKQMLAEIKESSKILFSGNKFAVSMAVLNSVLTWTLLKLMPYFVLIALGATPNPIAVIAMGVIAQLSSAWVPTPGAVGGIEAGTFAFFSGLHGVDMAIVGSFVLLYRLMDYHMDVLFSAPVSLRLLAGKLGANARTADLSSISDDISAKMAKEREKYGAGDNNNDEEK
ncbi:MAG TPA: lysylphosphatidylglycerol synthase transmembrane domain-containing protein [Caldisericia bacterium]|nr:lysylphosphatidylglycerol synthase transmembrane domain-containing protein [Caldisericia bacterium]HRV75581.1 lysylphosphatidylglycerol synthase transmembrane domain-containing protein [Caldisericia bacterium]